MRPVQTAGAIVPFAVETHGRLGKPALALLGKLAAPPVRPACARFPVAVIDGVLQQLIAVLNKCNWLMETAVASFVLRHPGRKRRPPCIAGLGKACNV